MENIVGVDAHEAPLLIKERTECDFLVWAHYGHPRGCSYDIMKIAGNVDAIEISNALYHGRYFPAFEAIRFINALRSKNKKTIATGGLDIHFPMDVNANYCAMCYEGKPDREKIFELLKKGNFTVKNRFMKFGQGPYGPFFTLCSFMSYFVDCHLRRVGGKIKRFIKGILWRQ